MKQIGLIILVSVLTLVNGISLPRSKEKLESKSISIEPRTFDTATTFYLYTIYNKDQPQIIQLNNLSSLYNSYFNANVPTKFIIHGLNQNKDFDLTQNIKNAYLENYNVNIIAVGWSGGTQFIDTFLYYFIRWSIPGVANTLKDFVIFLNTYGNLTSDKFTCIGHSLGAHICGLAGKYLPYNLKANTIIGLDPAGPLFDCYSSTDRLGKGDAHYVEIIHTNAGFLGISCSCGDVDIYVNEGKTQSACGEVDFKYSHMRAGTYFAETIRNTYSFCAKATNFNTFAYMGGEPSNAYEAIYHGDYFVYTFECPPFALGYCLY